MFMMALRRAKKGLAGRCLVKKSARLSCERMNGTWWGKGAACGVRGRGARWMGERGVRGT